MTSRAIYEIECGPEIHEIEIRDGKPHMLNHDEDMLEAFIAFGAEVPECLQWVKRWTWRWHEEAVLHKLTPAAGRHTNLTLDANLLHLPYPDRKNLDYGDVGIGRDTGTVFHMHGGWLVFAWPGPAEYMDDEREEWVEDNGFSQEFLTLLKLAGDHGIAYVFLHEEGAIIKGLPVFELTSGGP
jgi:hypothetical protein